MLKLIVGTKGSGKTKTMIDMIDKAVKTTSGNIVVIEKCMKLTTEINHSARLVDVDEYGVAGADMLYGFVAGVLAGNYDITELFLDGILRITDHDMAAAAKVCLLYTSDAADELDGVDLGGRRIIKKKFFQAEDGIRDQPRSRGLGDVYKRQLRY